MKNVKRKEEIQRCKDCKLGHYVDDGNKTFDGKPMFISCPHSKFYNLGNTLCCKYFVKNSE